MYRFPDTNQVNFQCDVVICKGEYSRVAVVEWPSANKEWKGT